MLDALWELDRRLSLGVQNSLQYARFSNDYVTTQDIPFHQVPFRSVEAVDKRLDYVDYTNYFS